MSDEQARWESPGLQAPDSATGAAVILLRVLALLALLLFEPVVLGYLYYGHLEGNPILMFMRRSLFFCFFFMFLAAWVGRRWGWITAPGVRLVSGVLYGLVELKMQGPGNFSENMAVVLVMTLVFALPMGLVVSYYFSQQSAAQPAAEVVEPVQPPRR